MTDDWLKEIDQKNMEGAVLLDFSAAFGVIDWCDWLQMTIEKTHVMVVLHLPHHGWKANRKLTES